MSRKIVLYAVILVLAPALWAVSGCGDKTDSGKSTQDNSSGSTQAAVPASVGKGHPAPDFTLRKINGGELQLSSLRGKAVIVDFWDTWCPPCRKALPHLQELSEAYSEDLVVVGVALGREGEAKVRSYAKDHGLTFTMVLFNNDQKLIDAFGGIESIPTTFLIDREGIIREKWIGGWGLAQYEKGVKEVLGF